MPRNTSISTKPNQPRRRNSIAHSQRKNNSMSNRMNRIATVENLIGKRPSLIAMGSLPHSNGSSFTGVSRLGAMRAGMPSSAPATPAANKKVRRIGRYSMLLLERGPRGRLGPWVACSGRVWLRSRDNRSGVWLRSRDTGSGAVRLSFGVVRGADERACLDVREAERPPRLGQLGELLRPVITRHRQVLRGRAQV